MKKTILTRRKALAGLGSLAAASPLVADHPPKLIGEPPGRIAPRADLVNVLEFENMAERKLAPDVYRGIAGGDRSFFDRITFRPRMMVPTTHLDLTISLFGDKMFAPIMAGPIERLQNYHPDGEAGMVRAASAAKSWMVVSSGSSLPIEKIAAESKTTLWYQVYPEEDMAAVRTKMDRAVKADCKAICITVRAPSASSWASIDQMRKGIGVPVLIKGIMTPQEATAALKHGIDGIVVSNYGGLPNAATASSIEMLPSIVDAVGGRAPILIDGSFRRGSDIFKALAYGATAVMLGRPVVWGLAAYGPDGAQQVLEMLQTEVARDMAHCGRQTIKDIDRAVVKLHEA
jgi:isopentenyl diphosphate isomerase/L-lactate dehydrogenase-like FMN-dependent dehydrogenase